MMFLKYYHIEWLLLQKIFISMKLLHELCLPQLVEAMFWRQLLVVS